MWRYIKRTLSVLLTLVILAIGTLAVVVKLHHGQFLSVQSGSMSPTLKKGDLVQVTRIPAAKLAVGDVVTFINPNNSKQTITHRIVALPSQANYGKIITKGDANTSPDEGIMPSAVIGKVSRHLPYAGNVFDLVRKPTGLILLIYIPALAIIIAEIKRLTKYYREQQPYVAEGYDPPKTPISTNQLGIFVLVLVVAGIAGLFITKNVLAIIKSTANLTGNSINATNPQNHILISKLNLRCGDDDEEDNNLTSANLIPRITIYNPTNNTIVLDGWQLLDNSGVILSIPAHTSLQAGHAKIVRLHLSTGGLHGLQYAGDRLILQNAAHIAVDALSWGTDTSQLNPPISSLAAGTVVTRSPINLDTNSKTDWTVSPHQCHDDNGGHHSTENEDESESHEDSFDSTHNPHQENGYDLREPNTEDD